MSSVPERFPFARENSFDLWQQLRRLKRVRDRRRDPASNVRAFKVCEKNLPIMRRLYGDDITIGEVKALFPLKVTGEGPGRRYWLVPKIVDRWLLELPSA